MAENNDNQTLTPTFIIYINGSRMTAEQEADVKEIIIVEKDDAPSSFIIKMSDMIRQWTDSNDLSGGSEIRIMIGYKDAIEELMNGEIIEVCPSYRMNSDDEVIIKGYNHLHRLIAGEKTHSFTDMTGSDIIKQIAEEVGLGVSVEDIGKEYSFTMQSDQNDYDYLMSMARKHNCKMWSKDGILYFKRIEENIAEDVVIEWGKTLLEFYPRSRLTGLVTQVEVRGWDINSGEAIVGTASLDDITLKIGGETLGQRIVQENFGDRKIIFIDEDVVDQNSADKAALDIITKNSMKYIAGSGKSQGNNKIRAGSFIELKELGVKFSGKYYVNSVKHSFSASRGYSTSFDVTKNAV